MVIREWRGRASAAKRDTYPEHFRAEVLPALHALPGFVGATLSERLVDGEIEFLVLTRWESIDAIKAFAGDAIEKAVVEPGGVAALIDYDATVQHYGVIEDV
jgi:heme-degrading monooxygenase HmoA